MKDKTSSSEDKEGYVEAAINESIRKLDYGDLLWVRLHGSSWWPAQVVDESTVSAINQPRKRRREGEVLVRLYGSYKYLFINPISTLLEFKNNLEKYSGNYIAILEESLNQDLHQLKFATIKKKEIKTKGKVVADASQERIAKKKQNAISKKLPSSASRKKEQDMKHKKPKASGAVSPGTSSGKTSVGAAPKTSLKRARSSSHNSEQGTSKKQKPSGSQKNKLSTSPGKMGSPRTKVQTPNTAQRNLRKRKNTPSEEPEPEPEPAKEPSARKVKVMQFLGLASPTGSPFIPNGSISNSA